MPKCSFCKNEEDIETPICQSCGSLRYPIENRKPANDAVDRQQIIKTSATVAAAIVTPGSFVVLAIVGAARLIQK